MSSCFRRLSMSASKMAFVALRNSAKFRCQSSFITFSVNAKATINMISFGLRCVLITFVVMSSEFLKIMVPQPRFFTAIELGLFSLYFNIHLVNFFISRLIVIFSLIISLMNSFLNMPAHEKSMLKWKIS